MTENISGFTKYLISHFYCNIYMQCNIAFYTSLANVKSRSRSLYAVARPSVCRLSVMLVHPTQAVVIFGNFSKAFDTLAFH